MSETHEHPFHDVPTREALELLPTGLCLLTAEHDGQDNWQFVQRGLALSAGPPTTVLVVLTPTNKTTELVEASGEFGLAICSTRHAEMVDPSRGVTGHKVDDKFAAMGLERLPAKHIKAPLVSGSYANLECRVLHRFPLGDRTIYVAEVLAMYHDPSAEPVVHYARKIYRFLHEDPIG